MNASVEVKGLKGNTYLRSPIGGSVGGEVNGNMPVDTVTRACSCAARSAQRIDPDGHERQGGSAGRFGRSRGGDVSGKIRGGYLGSLGAGPVQEHLGDITANYSLADRRPDRGRVGERHKFIGFASSRARDIDVESLSGTSTVLRTKARGVWIWTPARS